MASTVGDVMSSPVITISREKTVRDAAKLMSDKGIGSLVVDKGGKKLLPLHEVGIITERDVVSKVVAKGLDAAETLVGDVMSSNLTVVDSGESIQKASDIMHGMNIRRLPVVEGGKVVGIVGSRDVHWSLAYDVERKLAGIRKRK